MLFNGCTWPGNDLIRSVSVGFDFIYVHVSVMDSFRFGGIRYDRIQYEVVCFDLCYEAWVDTIAFVWIQAFSMLVDLVRVRSLWVYSI